MSDTLVFPTVKLESFARNHRGGSATFSSTYPKVLADAMKWAGVPDGFKSGKLEGELHATSLLMQPKDTELYKWQIQFPISKVDAFEVYRLELDGHRGKGTRIELRFKVQFVDVEACRYLEEYMCHAGEAKASLTVSYVEQTELDLANQVQTDQMPEATAPEND